MKPLESVISRAGGTAVAVTALAVMATILWLAPAADTGLTRHGLLFTTREHHIAATPAATVAAITLAVATALMLLLLNKVYTFIRAVTNLQATVMAVLIAAWPAAAVAGTAMELPLLLTLVAIPVFESYERPASQRRCLAAAAAVSTGCLFDYAYAVLLPPVIIGFINAKAMNVKTGIATALGLLAPPWTALACGLAHLRDFNVPVISPVSPDVLTTAPTVAIIALAALAALTLTLMVTNVIATETNRLVLRVHNSFFHLTAVSVVAAMLIDTGSAATLYPLLATAAAHEITQRFAVATEKR